MDIFSNLFNIIYFPIGMIFKFCYMLVSDYGAAILIFAIIAKIAMLPMGIKNEKSRIKMAEFQPKLQALQEKYKGNTRDPKYADEMQKLGYNPMSGCLPQLIQLPFIFAIWNAIRNPLTYIFGNGALPKTAIPTAIDLFNADPTLFPQALQEKIASLQASTSGEALTTKITEQLTTWLNTNQIQYAAILNKGAALPIDISSLGYQNINLTLFGLGGIDLGASPELAKWTVIIPILSGVSSFLVGIITQKLTTPKTDTGVTQPKNNSMTMMLYIMPLISVFIGFTFSLAVGYYWILSNILALGQTFLLNKMMNRKKPIEEVVVKEKKLNYNQIVKQEKERKSEENVVINVEKVEEDNSKG